MLASRGVEREGGGGSRSGSCETTWGSERKGGQWAWRRLGAMELDGGENDGGGGGRHLDGVEDRGMGLEERIRGIGWMRLEERKKRKWLEERKRGDRDGEG